MIYHVDVSKTTASLDPPGIRKYDQICIIPQGTPGMQNLSNLNSVLDLKKYTIQL